ncbi:MAG: hypothetical protein U0X34_09215 [Bacteroidia bacterium]
MPTLKLRQVKFTIHYSLFTIHYSLFTIHCSLFTVHYSLFTIHYSLLHKLHPPVHRFPFVFGIVGDGFFFAFPVGGHPGSLDGEFAGKRLADG